MNTKFLLAALTAGLTISFAAVADVSDKDAPATSKAAAAEQTAKTEPGKKKVKPHSHVEAKGGMVPAASSEANAQPNAQPKKPLHDHQKFHKQM